MKKTLTAIIAGLILICSMCLLAFAGEPLEPLEYSTTTNYLKYSKVIDWLYKTEGTNKYYYGLQTQETNVPAQIIHSVTYGVGTNKHFVLHSAELLEINLSNGWYNVDYKCYNAGTWITKDKN